MNLAFRYRPKDFSEVIGQEFVKSVIKGIIKNPVSVPRSYIFYGEYGCAKTTVARIFAKMINGLDREFKILDSPFYYEFDSAVVGNVDVVRELRDVLGHSYSEGYKVVVYDEASNISIAAQSALLKPLEEANQKIFYLFLTTDVDKLLKTIRSRSVEIKFDLVSKSNIVKHLKNICEKEDKNISEEALNVIASRSYGHVRDSLMMLDKCFIVGEDQFLNNMCILHDRFEELFSKVQKKDLTESKKDLLAIIKNPLVYVKQDLETFMMKSIFVYGNHQGVFKSLKFQQLMQLFSYYVQNKASAFSTSSDAFSFLYIMVRIVGGFIGNQQN